MAEERSNVKAYARVEITVEVTLASPWGPDAPLKEIHRVGARDAIDTLNRLFGKVSQDGIRIVPGIEPKVTAVMVESK